MPEWSFTLILNQPLTREQADAFDHCDAFMRRLRFVCARPRGPHPVSVSRP